MNRSAATLWIVRTLLFVGLAGLALPALASQIRPLNLEELTDRADRIFSGRCVAVRVARDPELDRDVTIVTVAVTRAVKGEIHGQVVFKMLGRQEVGEPEATGVEGLPRFRRGEEVILFLYGDSPAGLTSPVGFGHGKFSVTKDKKGQRQAINAFANTLLFDRLSLGAKERLAPGIERQSGRKAIPPDALLDMVEKLDPQGERHGR